MRWFRFKEISRICVSYNVRLLVPLRLKSSSAQPRQVDVVDGRRYLEITDANSTRRVSGLWLRDHCRCSECYNSTTYQRSKEPHEMDLNVKINEARSTGVGLNVDWSDNHSSKYLWSWLTSVLPFQPAPIQPIPWNASDAEARLWSTVSYANKPFTKEEKTQILRSLQLHGLVAINNVEPSIKATENVITMIAPLMKTFFGEMWDFMADLKHTDTAYSNVGIGPHTDTTYFTEPAGLQVFHCLHHDGDGGLTGLVDGFFVASQLRDNHPDSYELLSNVNIPSEYIEPNKAHFFASAPVFQHDHTGDLERVRYNMYDRAAMSHLSADECEAVYYALAQVSAIINAPSNLFQLKLSPGTLLIINNWRVLHSRTSFTGRRWMCGCYVSRTDYLDSCRSVNLL